jgi:hypothetical protein
MGRPNDKSISLFSALASACLTAYALAYLANSEWGLSRLKTREDALALVGLAVVGWTVKIVFQRKKSGGS